MTQSINMQLLWVFLLFGGVVHSREVVVHLFEWKFDDIARECVDFLAPYGYTAVQVSPVTENAIIPNRPWFERYQPFSFKIITRSGNEEQFKRMVETCNKVGVKTYVDMIVNHMSANLEDGTKGTGGSVPITKEKNYPDVPFTKEHFHPTCQMQNFQDPYEVRNCELVGLHDLNQTIPYVQDKIVEILNHLINIGVAGFRFDAAKHMWPEDLKTIYGRLSNLNTRFFKSGTRPFIYQEVVDQGGDVVRSSDYMGLGSVTEFKYSSSLGNAFKGKNLLKWLNNFGEEWNMLPSDKALVFVDNHDNQRTGYDIVTHKDSKLYKMAVGFMLSWPYGKPRVMSSFEFADKDDGPPHNPDMSIKDVTTNSDLTCNNGWVCEHRWRQIYSMVKFSHATEGTTVTQFEDNGSNQISYCRGNKGFVAINGDRYDMNSKRQTCLPSGVYCDVISGLKKGNSCTGKYICVAKDGTTNVNLKTNEEDGIMAIHIESRIKSSRRCGFKGI